MSCPRSIPPCAFRLLYNRIVNYRWVGLASSTGSRPPITEHHVGHVREALPARARRGEIAPEDRRQRVMVAEVEVGKRCNGDVELQRIDSHPKLAVPDAPREDFGERVYDR